MDIDREIYPPCFELNYLLTILGDADEMWREFIVISGRCDGSCDAVNLFFSSQSTSHCTMRWFLFTLSLRRVWSTFCVSCKGSCGFAEKSFSKSDTVTSWQFRWSLSVEAVKYLSCCRLTFNKLSSSSSSESSELIISESMLNNV